MFTLPSGVYYVGDLCYVMTESEWEYVISMSDRYGFNGIYCFPDGRHFTIYNTVYGDGIYNSNIGKKFYVDSGTIGCMLINNITSNKWKDIINRKLGSRVKFNETFTTSNKNGIIRFENININTN